jgi:hypothetical protein
VTHPPCMIFKALAPKNARSIVRKTTSVITATQNPEASHEQLPIDAHAIHGHVLDGERIHLVAADGGRRKRGERIHSGPPSIRPEPVRKA